MCLEVKAGTEEVSRTRLFQASLKFGVTATFLFFHTTKGVFSVKLRLYAEEMFTLIVSIFVYLPVLKL